MSVELMALCFRKKFDSHADRDVMLALCDHANDEGICWPSRAHIAWKMDRDPDTVKRCLKKFRDQGLIETRRKANNDLSQSPVIRVFPQKLPDKATPSPQGASDPSPRGASDPPKPSGEPPRENEEESTNVSSSSAESESKASSQPGKKKRSKENFTTKQLGVAELMERIEAMRERGYQIHSPTNSERKQFAAIFEQCVQDDYEAEQLLMAFDYMVEKAAGQVEGEPKAWCGYRTALDKVTIDGWRPPRRVTAMTAAEADELAAYAQETQDILANAMAALKGG